MALNQYLLLTEDFDHTIMVRKTSQTALKLWEVQNYIKRSSLGYKYDLAVRYQKYITKRSSEFQPLQTIDGKIIKVGDIIIASNTIWKSNKLMAYTKTYSTPSICFIVGVTTSSIVYHNLSCSYYYNKSYFVSKKSKYNFRSVNESQLSDIELKNLNKLKEKYGYSRH